MADKPKDQVSITLLDADRRNPRVFLIPRFTRPPRWVRHENKVYLHDMQGVYVEAFGWTIGFREDAVA